MEASREYNTKSNMRFVMEYRNPTEDINMEYPHEKDLKESFKDFWDDYEDFMGSTPEFIKETTKYIEMTEWGDHQDESLVGHLYGDFEDDEGVTKDEF